MKLNKNGWGFLEFFLFLIVFIVCLIVAFEGLKKLGLMDENNQFITNGNKTNESNNKKEEKPLVSYPSLEEKMVKSAKEYINDYYNNSLGLDTLNIRVSQLKSNGYLDKLEDNKGRTCTGYVSVYLDETGTIIYKPYLNCIEHKTEGYEERKDD